MVALDVQDVSLLLVMRQSESCACRFTLHTGRQLKACIHGSPRLISTVESMKLNSTVERYCLYGSTKVNEAVDFKMAANELVREGVVVICDSLIKKMSTHFRRKK